MVDGENEIDVIETPSYDISECGLNSKNDDELVK